MPRLVNPYTGDIICDIAKKEYLIIEKYLDIPADNELFVITKTDLNGLIESEIKDSIIKKLTTYIGNNKNRKVQYIEYSLTAKFFRGILAVLGLSFLLYYFFIFGVIIIFLVLGLLLIG